MVALGFYNVAPPSSYYGNEGVSYMACPKPSLLHISMDMGLSKCWACSKTCCGKWHTCFRYIVNSLNNKLRLKYEGFQDIDLLTDYLKKTYVNVERERGHAHLHVIYFILDVNIYITHNI
jgi:hypothetical protein